ncbi:MAG: AI-2E family transporter [Patescibacteria group bacterium]
MNLPHSGNVTINISPSSVLKSALVLIALYAVYLLRDLVLVVVAAVVIASAIEPMSAWFVRRRVPRTLGVVSIYLTIAVIVFGVVYLALPPLLFEAANFFSQAPQYFGNFDIQNLLGQFKITAEPGILEGISQSFSAGDLLSGIRSLLAIPGGVFQIVSSIFGGVFSFVLIIILSFYFAVQEKGIENFLKIVTPHNHQAYAIDLWRRSQGKIGQWMQGQLLLMLLVGVLVFLGLTILGVKHAFLFALLAGLLEVIPLFGPIISSIPAILVGFSDGGVSQALLVGGLFVIIQQFENHLIYPLVVHKVVGVPAMVVILALIIGAQLGGFLGAILSVPIASALMELVNDWKHLSSRPSTPHVPIS